MVMGYVRDGSAVIGVPGDAEGIEISAYRPHDPKVKVRIWKDDGTWSDEFMTSGEYQTLDIPEGWRAELVPITVG